MGQLNQGQAEFQVLLREVVQGAEAWGTALGAEVFSRTNVSLLSLAEGTLVVIDYAGIERTDVSFQREAIVETIRKHRPRLLFIAVNISDADVRLNVELALERRGESLLSRELGRTQVIGKCLTKEHKATLEALWAGRKEFTSGMLTAAPFRLESSTASARLTALWKAGLIQRVQGASPSGGREYKYFPIF